MDPWKACDLFQKCIRKSIQWYKNNLGLPAGVAILFAVMFFFLSFYGAEGAGAARYNRVLFSFIVAVFAAIASAVGTFAIIDRERTRNERKTEGHVVKNAIAEVVTRLEAEKPYSSLRVLNRELPWRLLDVITEIIDYSTTGGGVVVSAGPPKYVEYLKKLIKASQNSFQATLRGGENDPLYTINWFSKNDEELEEKKKKQVMYPMKKEEKLAYLDMINKKQGISKERILIFDKNKESEFRPFLNSQFRKDYFSHSSKVTCYLIGPDELKELLLKEKNLREVQTGFIYEDFAIFDGQVVLKHDGKSSLFLGIKSQIGDYKSAFELLRDRPSYFLEVNETHIGEKTWEEFAKELDWFKKSDKRKRK